MAPRVNYSLLIMKTAGMMKMAIIGCRSQGAQHSLEVGHYSTGIWDLEKNPPCNAEDNMRAGLVVIEAWFRGY